MSYRIYFYTKTLAHLCQQIRPTINPNEAEKIFFSKTLQLDKLLRWQRM